MPIFILDWRLFFFLLQQSSSKNIFLYWLLKMPYTKELTLEFIQSTKWKINGVWAILSPNMKTVASVILQIKNKKTTTIIIIAIFFSLLFDPWKFDPKAFFISLLISITCKNINYWWQGKIIPGSEIFHQLCSCFLKKFNTFLNSWMLLNANSMMGIINRITIVMPIM